MFETFGLQIHHILDQVFLMHQKLTESGAKMDQYQVPLRYGIAVCMWAFGNEGAMSNPGHIVTSSTSISLDLLHAAFSAIVLPKASQSLNHNQWCH